MAKLLIVDDSFILRRWVKDILKETDYDIIEAANGKLALDEINQTPPDCIILDLLMPEYDGMYFLEQAKSKNINIPIIILSADIQKTTKKKCMDLGAFDFLNKPPEKESLINTINRALLSNDK